MGCFKRRGGIKKRGCDFGGRGGGGFRPAVFRSQTASNGWWKGGVGKEESDVVGVGVLVVMNPWGKKKRNVLKEKVG